MTPADARRLPLPKLFHRPRKSSESQFFVKCPAHADEHPSCSLRRIKGEWKWRCFSCHAAGDIVDLVMLREQCGYNKALKWIVDQFGDVELDTPPEPEDPYVLVCAAPGCGNTRNIGPRTYKTPGRGGYEWRSGSELEALTAPDWEVGAEIVGALCPGCAWKLKTPFAPAASETPTSKDGVPEVVLQD